jgi:hypothetical protein
MPDHTCGFDLSCVERGNINLVETPEPLFLRVSHSTTIEALSAKNSDSRPELVDAGSETLPAIRKPPAATFFQTLSGKVSAWCCRSGDRELIILDMCGQADFSRCVLESPGSPLKESHEQERTQPVAVWDRLRVGVVQRGLHSEFSVLYSSTLSLGRHFSLPTASRQEHQARSRAKFPLPLA